MDKNIEEKSETLLRYFYALSESGRDIALTIARIAI
jgi:hypothetical protein